MICDHQTKQLPLSPKPTVTLWPFPVNFPLSCGSGPKLKHTEDFGTAASSQVMLSLAVPCEVLRPQLCSPNAQSTSSVWKDDEEHPTRSTGERRWGKLLAICQASPLCFFIFSFCSLLESFYLCSGFHGNCISCLSSLALNFLFDFPSSQDMTLFSFCKNELSVVFSLVVDIFKGGKRDFHSAAESV